MTPTYQRPLSTTGIVIEVVYKPLPKNVYPLRIEE